MKRQDFILSFWYIIMIVLILNLIFTIGTYKVCERMIEQMFTEAMEKTKNTEVTETVTVVEKRIDIVDPYTCAAYLPQNEPEPIEEPEVEYFDVPLDESLQEHIFTLCDEYGIEPELVISVIRKESGYSADAQGDSGKSLGLMQIQPRWHRDRMTKLGCDNLLDPYQNVTVGIDLLAELIEQRGSTEWALMAYNGGPSYANKLAAAGKVSEYASTVMSWSNDISR